MNIDGNTELIAHIGYPTHSFKSPLIYNPYFEKEGINAFGGADGMSGRTLPRFPAISFSIDQYSGCVGHYAAQSDHCGSSG
jgi:shikimate dehydrogenase